MKFSSSDPAITFGSFYYLLCRCKKDDLKRIAKATGGTILVSLASIENDGEEVFEASNLGVAESVAEDRFADDECLIIKGGAKHTQSSIILRGANSFMLDEMERSMNDALQVRACVCVCVCELHCTSIITVRQKGAKPP